MTLREPRPVRRRLADLTLLGVNARYMTQATYQRLVANLRKDGYLTSTPLIYGGEGEYPEGRELVLSGNHRVKGGLDAGIEEAWFLLIDQPLPNARQIGLQLTHNAVQGQDDLAILKQLYDSIGDVDTRAYAGLDDRTLELLDKIDAQSITEAALDFYTVSLVFLPPEADHARAVLDRLGKLADGTWLARYADATATLDALASAHSAHNVGNVATAMGLLIAIVEEHLTDLQVGYLDPASDKARHQGHVGLEVVLGSRTVPAALAATLTRELHHAIETSRVQRDKPWQLIELMLAAYLGAQAARSGTRPNLDGLPLLDHRPSDHGGR